MVHVLVLLSALCRLLPHPPNFTPVLAVALFGGAHLPRRAAIAVPLLALLLSDLLLGYPFTGMNLVVYACFLSGVWLGTRVGTEPAWGRRLGAAASGSVLFYLVTNFAVWLSPEGMYAHTLEGLLRCYVMALPFFRNSLAGDLLWTGALFGLHDLARAWVASRRAGGSRVLL